MWRVSETIQDARRIPERHSFECLHPICRAIANKLIQRKGAKELERYEFPECGLQDAPVMKFLARALCRQNEELSDLTLSAR